MGILMIMCDSHCAQPWIYKDIRHGLCFSVTSNLYTDV